MPRILAAVRGYGMATISRLLQMICLFCRISSLLQGTFATCNVKEPTNGSHPIASNRTRRLRDSPKFCRISSLLWSSFAKETCNVKEPTNGSHPIASNRTRRLRDSPKFCRISSLLWSSFAKETCNVKEPTHGKFCTIEPSLKQALHTYTDT